MTRNWALLAIGLVLATYAYAGPTSVAAPQGLSVMTHSSFHVWKVEITTDQPLADLEMVFNDLYNWDARDNMLYVSVLDQDALADFTFDSQGLYVGVDQPSYGNFLDQFGAVEIGRYSDPDGPATVEDVHFAFNEQAMDTVRSSLYNNTYTFGLGIDADCTFYTGQDTAIKVTCCPVVPAPGALLLGSIGAGLVGCLSRRRVL